MQATGDSFVRKPSKADHTHTFTVFTVSVNLSEAPSKNLFTLNKTTLLYYIMCLVYTVSVAMHGKKYVYVL